MPKNVRTLDGRLKSLWCSVNVHRRFKKNYQEKEEKSKEYRNCKAYWLLVVVDFYDNAQDQEIQIESPEEITSDIFERIIVCKTIFGHVSEWPIGR